MDSSQDTEITLGTAKLLGLFFGLVIICAVFFALGYTLGRKSDPGLTASAAAPLQTSSNGTKPAGSATPAPPMTFYKSVEQKDANSQLTPASPAGNSTNPAASSPAAAPSPGAATPSGTPAQPSETGNPSDATTALPSASYFVQVAAVSKQEDADSLVDALKKKQYPAFVANNATDKLFRVQVGPFAEIKDAEAMRSRLINDGYNPILKK
jgi:DedD protein